MGGCARGTDDRVGWAGLVCAGDWGRTGCQSFHGGAQAEGCTGRWAAEDARQESRTPEAKPGQVRSLPTLRRRGVRSLWEVSRINWCTRAFRAFAPLHQFFCFAALACRHVPLQSIVVRYGRAWQRSLRTTVPLSRWQSPDAKETLMNDHDEYLSKDRQHLAALQRQRRARMVRIDYMPSEPAMRVFEARQRTARPGSAESTRSTVLDAIVLEWAQLTGINNQKQKGVMTSGGTGIKRPIRVRARMTSSPLPATDRRCGTRRHRDGQPCQSRPEPGKRRCRFHGGRSTGPRTAAGRERALANLRHHRTP